MSDISQLSELNVHDTLIDLAKNIKEDTVAISLSSGIDSMSVLFSLLECGKKVVAYSFTLDDRQSRDFIKAKEIANYVNIDFVPVILPTDIEQLKSDVIMLGKKYNCRKKTDYICTWPYLYLTKAVKEKVLATGMAADGHFVISKKGVLHYKNNVQEFRKSYFSNPSRCQLPQRTSIANEYAITLFEPYLSIEMYDYLFNSTWNECNRPQQKMPIRRAFNYPFIYNHTNFQLGDSGISDHFNKLLYTDLNTKNHKSVVGIFNNISRGDFSDAQNTLF